MIDPMKLTLALIAGIMLGAIFFSSLWWTVRKAVSSKHPGLWFFSSMLLRMCIVLLGFYFILGDSWQKLLMGMLGFIVARLIVMRRTRDAKHTRQLTQEGGNAS